MAKKIKKGTPKKRGFLERIRSLGRGAPEISSIKSSGESPKIYENISKKNNLQISSQTSAEIEKLKAQVEMLKDLRNADSDKMNNISEQIGSMRSLFFEKEKRLKRIETKSEKASDLVKTMNPKKVIMGFSRYEVRLNKLESKNELFRGMIDEIFSQMKDIRTTIKRFKDSEALIKLNKEVKNEITKIQKISNLAQSNLKKMQELYLDFERDFSNINKK